MRVRIWIILALAVTLIALTGCSDRISRGPTPTPVPTKTLRPTFTHTPPKPTVTPTPTEVPPTPTPVPPTDTPVPPTPEPTPTQALQPRFTVTNPTANVRSGPGTNYGLLGQVRQGQSFDITGKNPAGDWWEFTFNGRAAWISASLVSAQDVAAVQVAETIPAPPTAAPRPPAQPATRAPAPPPATPAPALRYGPWLSGLKLRPNTNNYVTVWCLVINRAQNGLVAGTMRVMRGGATVAEKAFLDGAKPAKGDAGYPSEFDYNPECKVELPAADGVYSAYLIEGGQQVSPPFEWTVSGATNRTAILQWKEN